MHQLAERLGVLDHSDVEQNLVPEARVEQVQNRVLGAPDVQVHGHPVVVGLLGEDLVVVAGVEVAEVVPARARPLGHRVGLASEPLAVPLEETPLECSAEWALRGRRVGSRRAPAGAAAARSRRARWGGCSRSRYGSALRADRPAVSTGKVDRDRLAPVALAREDPVPELVVDLAPARCRAAPRCANDVPLHLGRGLAVELPGANGDAVAGERLPRAVRAGSPSGLTTSTIGRPNALRELEVPLVVSRHRHDGAGAVGAEHVVRREDRDLGRRSGGSSA